MRATLLVAFAHAVLAMACTLATGCALGPSRAQYGLMHPLNGRVWDVAGGAFTTEEALVARLAAARFVLLGEQHDNTDHHVHQGRIIRALVRDDQSPAVVLEMLDTDDSDAIAACIAAIGCDARALAQAVRWEESGWPDWRAYAPVLDSALGAGLPIAPGSPPAEEVRAFVRTGAFAGGDAELYRLGLDRPLDPAVRAAMEEEIRASHCGHAPEEMLGAMVDAQRLRDAHLAESLAMAAPMGRALLIAGFGHVRNDRAVPAELHRIFPENDVVSVAFMEVNDALTDPSAYAESFGTDRLPFNFVWFTPRMDDADPCEQFREQLQRMRR